MYLLVVPVYLGINFFFLAVLWMEMAWCCIARDSWTGTSKEEEEKRIEKHASTEMQVVSQFFTTMVLKGLFLLLSHRKIV